MAILRTRGTLSRVSILLTVACFLFTSAPLAGQEVRATLLGTVTDPSSAAVVGAQVTLTNLGTNLKSTATTDAGGSYTIPFLPPGEYRLVVEVSGFKTFDRSPIELRVNDRTRIDVPLEVGNATERVVVTAEAPLLEAQSSDRGQVIQKEMLTDLPTRGRNPYMLMGLTPGAQASGGSFSYLYARPFDQTAFDNWSINGGRNNTNEFQLDGLPNTQQAYGNTGLAYVPPVEATEEFKVQTNTFDAQFGRTGGGTISVAIKSGTNQLHGAGYWYLKRTDLVANQFVNNANGMPRTTNNSDQRGFEFAGPVFLPKVYNGKNRTFFMFAYEHMDDEASLSGSNLSLLTIPTMAQRAGDFSHTLTASGALYTIYDPLTTRPNPNYDPSKPTTLSNGQYIRTPFAGNTLPANRLNPIAQKVFTLMPAPNLAGNPVTAASNWAGVNLTEVNHFPNIITRIDQSFGRWRTYVRANYNIRHGSNPKGRNGWLTPLDDVYLFSRQNKGAVWDLIGTLSPTTIVDFRWGYTRYVDGGAYNSHYNQADLGFPSSLVNQLLLPNQMPTFAWTNYQSTQGTGGRTLATPSETHTIQANVTTVRGSHQLKFGEEVRDLHNASLTQSVEAGTYASTQSWTSSNPLVTDPASGNAVASFLLGNLASASVNMDANPYWSQHYFVTFLQDNWQATKRLSLNLGVRWDYEAPEVERFNRMVRGFAFGAASPIQVTGLSNLTGGLLYAGVNGQPRGEFNPDRADWQPRFGIAYKVLNSKPLVFRGGIGKYYLGTVNHGQTTGFTSTTAATVSTATYLPAATLSDPFPSGLTPPVGSSQGLATWAGNAITFNDATRKIPYVWQFSGGFQYEAFGGLLLDASYVGNRSDRLQVGNSLNVLSVNQLALGTSYLNTVVSNPFYGVLSPQTTLGAQATAQRRALIVPYPQFSTITESNMSIGYSWYNGLQLKVQRRAKHGIGFLVSYTASKTMEAVSYLNPQDTKLDRELSAWDTPQKLQVSGLFDLPFGAGKPLLNHGIGRKLLGGWHANWNLNVEKGPPMSLPAGYYINGDPKLPSGQQSLSHWFNTSSSIWVVQPADTLRVTPLRSGNIRRYDRPQLDAVVIRDFRIREGHTLQFRIEASNITNTPIFDFPNTTPSSNLFGTVLPSQLNRPREAELAFRYSF